MDYTQRSTRHTLTPTRKVIAKAIGRGNWKATALEILKDENGRKYCLQKIGIMIRNELHTLCSPVAKSILGSQSLSDLSDFTWERLIKELEMYAPVLLSILRDATVTRTDRPNRGTIIGMCAALLLKHRYFKMSLVQKIFALVLYSGHSGKQV